jgi:hypothetical protein
MIRKLILWILSLQCLVVEGQQLKLGNNPSTINKSSLLELESNNQGLLLTRIPDTAVSTLTTAPTGTLIFFNGDSTLRLRKGGRWQTVSLSGLPWLLGGNTLSGVQPFGTLSNTDLPFYSNGVERMRLTAGGLLGIGTSSPSTALHVFGTNPLTLTGVQTGAATDSVLTITNGLVRELPASNFVSSGTAWLLGGNAVGSVQNFGTTSAFDLPFVTGGTERMRITSGGLVGIGTTTPGTPLHIIATNGNLLYLQTTQSATTGILFKTYTASANPGSQIAAVDDGHYSNHLLFSTKIPNADANALAERMRITSSGSVGIGTTTPGQLLDVKGTIVSSATTYPNYAYNSANRMAFGESNVPANETGSVVQFGSGSNARNMLFAFTKTNVNTSYLGNDGTQMMLGSEASIPITFRIGLVYTSTNVMASGAEMMRLTPSGFLGINTTTPSTYLHVFGTNPLTLTGVQTGTATDSVLTIASGLVRKLPISTFVSSGSDWLLGGNTVASAQTIGTNNAIDFPFETNNIERMRLTSGGFLGIGTTAPATALHVFGTNPLTLTGVQTGATTDSMLTITGGLVRKLPASNYVTNLSGSVTGYNVVLNSSTGSGTSFALPRDSLSRLLDVSETSPASGQLLQYNGTQWVNITPTYLSTTGLTAGSIPFAGTGGLLRQNNAALFWDSTNVRLGIGTNTPASDLTVYQSTGATSKGIRLTGNSIGGTNTGSGAAMVLGFNQTNNKQWWLGDPDYMGNVNGTFARLSTSNGSTILDAVSGDNSIRRPIRLGVGSDANSAVVLGDDGNTATPSSYVWDDNNMAIGSGYRGSTAPANGLLVQGNVGIGTPSPATVLHVFGTNPLTLTGVQTGATTDSVLTINSGLVRKLAAGNYWSTLGNGGTSGATNFLGTTNSVGLHIRTNNVERMYLDSVNGTVGIGTNTFTTAAPEKLLVSAGTTTSYNAIVARGSVANYFQLNINNQSNNSGASSDVVATADNGTETVNYVDLGINSSQYNTSSITGGPDNGYLYSTGNDFVIGNGSTGHNLIFFNGGTASTNEAMRINSSGQVGVNNTNPAANLDVGGTFKLGTSGTVLNSVIKGSYTTSGAQTINGAGGTLTLTVSITGAALHASVLVSPEAALPAGVSIAYAYVSAAGTVKIGLVNAAVTFNTVIIGGVGGGGATQNHAHRQRHRLRHHRHPVIRLRTIWTLCALGRLAAAGLICLPAARVSAQIYLPPGADLAVHPGDTVAIFGNVLNSGRWGSLRGGVVNFYGSEWQNGAGSTLPDEAYYGLDTTQGAGGIFRFLQTHAQYLTGAYSQTTGGPSFPGLAIGNPGGLILEPGSDVRIRRELNFENGYMFLNGDNLFMGSKSAINGYSDQQFVVTGLDPAGGSLYRESLTQNDNLVVFPVGSYPGSYSPLALQTHTAYPITFRGRVFDSVYDNATSGSTNPETVVLKTWNVGQQGLNIADVSVWLQHDARDEGRFFPLHRDSSYVSLYTGTGWDTTGPKGILNPGTLTTGPQLPGTYENLRDFTSALLANAYLSVADQPNSNAPLEFQAYRATIRLVRTFWYTRYERDVAHYELQRRRADEDSFYTVAVVPTQTPDGNSTTPLRYDQDDDDYYGDVTYYRVKVVGRDGAIHYSVIRLVPPAVAIVCSPNPAPGFFNVHIFGINRVVHMIMFDRAGQRIGAYDINSTAAISVPWLPAGMYILTFYDQNRLISTQKIILLRR